MKNKITSEKFHKWMLENGVKTSRLAELMGMKNSNQLTHCFIKTAPKDRTQRRITPEMAERVNAVLPLLAEEVRSLRIEYGEEHAIERRGRTYYPGCMDGIKALRKTLQVKPFVKKALGWTDTRWNSILVSKVNAAFGNITEADLTAINTTLSQIAVALAEFELLPDEPVNSSSSSD